MGAGGVAVAPGPVGVGGVTPQVWSASLTSAPDTGGGGKGGVGSYMPLSDLSINKINKLGKYTQVTSLCEL